MGFFKKKQPPSTIPVAAADNGPGISKDVTRAVDSTDLAAAESDVPKKAPLSQRLQTKRTDLTSASATSRLAQRNALAARQAKVSYVTGHAGTQLAIWGAGTGYSLAKKAETLWPLEQTLSAIIMLGKVAPWLTAYGDVLDLANEIERKIVNFVVLADTASDMFKSRITRDAMTERQIVEVKVILEKMEATTGQAMDVLNKVQDMSMINVTMQVATLKNEFAPIRVKVTNLLKTLHARITTIQLALFDAQANQAQVLRDGMAATADVVRGWITNRERDVIAAIRKSDEGHKQVARGLRELLKQIEELGVPPGVYEEVKNKEVVALWQFVAGNCGPLVDASDFVHLCAGLARPLYAGDQDSESADILFAWTIPIAQTNVLQPHELGLFDEHVDPSGQYVCLLKLDQVCEQMDEDVLEPVNVPTLLLWRVYAWVGFSQSLLDSLVRLTPTLSLVSTPLLKPVTSRLSTLLNSLRTAWHVSPAVAHRIDQLMPLLSLTRAGAQLAPSTQSLIDALTTLVQLTNDMTTIAADGAWLMDPEGDVAKEYTIEFPNRIALAWNKVVAAARAMGLDPAIDNDMPADQVAKVQKTLAIALDAQQSAITQLVNLTAPDDYPPGTYFESVFGALLTEWSLLTSDIDTSKRVQPVSSTESLLLLTEEEAARALPQLARVLAALSASPYVTRVTGLLVPQPDVYQFWGVLLSTPMSDVYSLHDVLSMSNLPLAARINLARDIAAGVFAVLYTRDRWTDVEPMPLEVSPFSVTVTMNAMGAWVAQVPPCAGVVPVVVREWAEAYVARTGGPAAKDVFALGKVVGELLNVLDDGKGGRELALLVARMCHANANERINVTLADVQALLDMIAGRVDLDATAVEELVNNPTTTTRPSAAPASLSATSPRASECLPQSQPSPPTPPPPTLPHYPSISLADAQTNFHTARNRIRNCTGRPLSDPDYDVADTVTLLLSAGMPGHVPMALVLAADMWYYGVIQPRQQPMCWETAWYLYARAAAMGCKYANVGLGDLLYFRLRESGLCDADRVDRAGAHYKLALEHVDNPSLNLHLTESQQARVHCGLGDVLTQRASAAATADAATAHQLYVQALAAFNRAYQVDSRCKRALARKAMFKIQQVGGEVWDRAMVLAWKQAAKSRDNPVPELMVRLRYYEMHGDVRGAEAVKRMLSTPEVPEH